MDSHEAQMVKDYINQGQYHKARQVLIMNLADPKAKKLLSKLDEVEAKARQPRSQRQTTTSTAPALQLDDYDRDIFHLEGIPRQAIKVILFNMGFWVLLAIGLTIIFDTGTTLNVVLMAAIACPCAFIIYYLQWRFFWWFIAIGWTLFTIALLGYIIIFSPVISAQF